MAERPLRVLFAIGGLGRGGSETQLIGVVTGLDPSSIQADVAIFTKGPWPLQAQLDTAGIPVHLAAHGAAPRAVRVPRALFRYAAIIRRTRPDVIYAWLEESSLYLVPLARMFGIPVVVARRNVDGARLERWRAGRALVHGIEARANLVTVNAEAVRAAAEARGISRERLRIVPNGHRDTSAVPCANGDVVRIGYLAGFRPVKGHRMFVTALSRMRTRAPWVAELAGSGALRDEIRELAHELGVADRVRFVGEVTDGRDFWRDRHVAALFSDFEGCPNALIEAALAGRPAVATRTGGIPEAVGPGAILVDVGDVDAAARALERLVDDPTQRRWIGAVGHQYASQRYAMSTSIAAHVAALREAAGVAT